MAIVTRYFGASSAGSGDGTSYANRAQLINAGVWSSVITSFNFSGSDSLLALCGPGTVTATAALTSGLFANAPSAANPLILHGCDGSGVQLTISDLGWISADTIWDDSGLPIITSTTNISTINLANCIVRFMKFTASGATSSSVVNTCALADWISIVDSSNNASAFAVSNNCAKLSHSLISMTGAAYRAGIVVTSTPHVHNCRVTGVTGSSGNRHGIEFSGSSTGPTISRTTITGCGGDGIGNSSSSTGHAMLVRHCTIANIGGTGIKINSTAGQTAQYVIDGCMITGCGAYGIDAQSAGRVLLGATRLRDNTSGNINGLGNYPTDWDNYTTDSDDATEYVDTAGGDYRIKNTASLIWGKGYGVADQPASGGGSSNVMKQPSGMTGGMARRGAI